MLRRPIQRDARSIFQEYARDPEVTRYLTWTPHQSTKETYAFLRRCRAKWRDGSGYAWGITHKEDDQLMGMIDLRPFLWFAAEIGFVLAKRFWRQGYMTEAARAVVDWALQQASVFRVWATCDIENVASQRVLEKVGMTREGILRRWGLSPTAGSMPRDHFVYSKVR